MSKPNAEWYEEHGYIYIRCSKCGFKGWTDTGVCDCPQEEDEEENETEA